MGHACQRNECIGYELTPRLTIEPRHEPESASVALESGLPEPAPGRALDIFTGHHMTRCYTEDDSVVEAFEPESSP